MKKNYVDTILALRKEIIAKLNELVKENHGQIDFIVSNSKEYVVNYDCAVGFPDSDDYYSNVVCVKEDAVIVENGYGYKEKIEFKDLELSTDDLADIIDGCRHIIERKKDLAN